jgi:NitT/TauT family transport system substrate-binding protein
MKPNQNRREDGMKMKSLIAALTAATVLAGASAAVAQEKINIGFTRTATDIGLFVADKRGYFKAEGLDVNFILFDSAARMITPFASGDLDISAGATSAGFYNAVARGIDMRIIADKVSTPPGRTSQTLVVRKALVDSGKFKSLADIKGLKLANTAPGTAAMGSLYKMVERAGLKISDVELVSLGFPQQVLALSSGAIDLALPAEPMTTEAITNDEAYPYHQIAVIFYSGKFATERRAAGVKFLKAFLRGVRDHNDALDKDGKFTGEKGEAIISILTEYTTIKDPAFYRSFALAFCNPDGTVHLDSLKNDYEVYKSSGLLEGTGDAIKPVDGSFLEAVLKDLGPYKKAN